MGELIAGRIICGLGVGLMTSTVGIYQAETVPAKTRGRWLTLQLLVFLAVSGFLIPLLPESPRWLVKHGDFDEALEVLIRLQGPERASERLAKIVEADTLEKQKTTNEFRSLFTAGSAQNFRRLCLACGIMVMHQLNGISLSKPQMRPFLVFGAAYQTASFAIIAALLALGPTHDSKVYGIAALVVMFLYYGVNAATWLGPSWAYPAEILPLQIREKGLALGNICYWLFQFLIVEITPTALANIGYRFYIILACFNLCSTLIVYFCYPETKSWSLEELDFLFARKYGGVTEAEIRTLDKTTTQQVKPQMQEHVNNATENDVKGDDSK
ncbi:MAG: hypothetical protein Q9157_003228 [Trypethelium eluteriae]